MGKFAKCSSLAWIYLHLLMRPIAFGRPSKLREIHKEVVRDLVKNGRSISTVAKTFNFHPSTIYLSLSRRKIDLMAPHRSSQPWIPSPRYRGKAGNPGLRDQGQLALG